MENQAPQPAPFMEWCDFHTGGGALLLFLRCSVWLDAKPRLHIVLHFPRPLLGQASDEEGKSAPTFLQHFQRPLWRGQLWFLSCEVRCTILKNTFPSASVASPHRGWREGPGSMDLTDDGVFRH